MQRSSWIVSAVGVAAFLAACAPDIPQVAQTSYVTVEFDPAATPALVPQPNSLAISPTTGLVVVPANIGVDTPTQTAFNQTYLNTLDGFPMESSATVTTSGAINPATLTTGVLVLDITNTAAPFQVAVTPSFVSGGADAAGTISIPPPGGQWTRGHTYAVTVIGGTQSGPFAALSGANGQQVTGSSTWALVASSGNCTTVASCAPPVPLCVLPDGGPGGPNSGCLPVTDLIPSQTAAAQLQELQSLYAPLLAALAGPPFSIPRGNVAILWTFGITTHAEVTFDPANTVTIYDLLPPSDAVPSYPSPAGTSSG